MDNREIEVRFPLDDSLKNKIKNLDFEPHNELDEYFFTRETVLSRDRWLRLRQKHGKFFFELKEKVRPRLFPDNISAMDETSCEISPAQYETIKKCFQKNFPLKMEIKKTRSVARRNGCEIIYDQIENLGDFIEIEGDKEKIDEVCSSSGIDVKQTLPLGYAEMMLNKLNLSE